MLSTIFGTVRRSDFKLQKFNARAQSLYACIMPPEKATPREAVKKKNKQQQQQQNKQTTTKTTTAAKQ